MLAIRMQRTGRKGHAMFRVVVQDSRRTPTSGKVVARLGSYDPHAKTIALDKEKASFYLEHGAQPSGRVAVLLKNEGIKLPEWVKLTTEKKREVRNADKRRSTRPVEPVEETAAPAEAPAEAAAAAEPAAPVEEAPVASEETPAVEAEPIAEDTTEEEAPEAAPEADQDEPSTDADETPAEK